MALIKKWNLPDLIRSFGDYQFLFVVYYYKEWHIPYLS